jgi:hypothetical protein
MKDDPDIVRLPSAWTMEHKRAQREIQLEAIWEAHNRPYSTALGQGDSLFADYAKKGDWAVQNWVVENLFLEGHIGLLVGDAGTGKSLACLDLMIAVASGRKWLQHFECMTSPVVYLAGEGKVAENMSHFAGLLLGRGESHAEFMRYFASRVHIITPSSMGMSPDAPLSSEAWWANVQALVTSTFPREARPRLWVLDPLLALINSTDKADDVRPFVARCRWLAEQTSGYVLSAHHNNKMAGPQTSRRQRIRGESMLVNLFDDVLVAENAEEPNLFHLYANKLKRGSTDDSKPMCHVSRIFTDISEHTFQRVLAEMGVQRTGEESPKSIKQITLRYIPYSAELHQKADESGEVEAPRRNVTDKPPKEEPEVVEEPSGGLDTSSWDRDQQRIWKVLTMNEEFYTTSGMQRLLREEHGIEMSTTKIQARFDALEALGVVGHKTLHPTAEQPKRHGTGYSLKSRVL